MVVQLPGPRALDDPEWTWDGVTVAPDGAASLLLEKGGDYSAPGRVEIGPDRCGELEAVQGGWRLTMDCAGTLRGLAWHGDRMLEPGEEGPHTTARGSLAARDCGARRPL